jgi:hypothetical protein
MKENVNDAIKEVRREKVKIPPGMTTREIIEKYGLTKTTAYSARRRGFFVKNYSRPQVKVDPSRFNTDICYNIAGKVFKRNLSFDPVAVSIKEDLIQEAVKSMWEKSGILKESKKYSINYQYYFVARNYMNSYLSKWKLQMRYYDIYENLKRVIKRGKRFYDPFHSK